QGPGKIVWEPRPTAAHIAALDVREPAIPPRSRLPLTADQLGRIRSPEFYDRLHPSILLVLRRGAGVRRPRQQLFDPAIICAGEGAWESRVHRLLAAGERQRAIEAG